MGVDKIKFGKALRALRKGKQVQRSSWNSGILSLQEPTPDSKMTEPYLYIEDRDGNLVPWHVGNDDLLANDWEVVS